MHREHAGEPREAVGAGITEQGDRSGPSPPGSSNTGGTMIDALSRNWGWVALRGVGAILFGILAMTRPGMSLASLVLLFGAYAFMDGTFMLVSVIANRQGRRRGVRVCGGGVCGASVCLLCGLPLSSLGGGVTAMILLAIIAAWAIITGVTEIVV